MLAFVIYLLLRFDFPEKNILFSIRDIAESLIFLHISLVSVILMSYLNEVVMTVAI